MNGGVQHIQPGFSIVFKASMVCASAYDEISGNAIGRSGTKQDNHEVIGGLDILSSQGANHF